MNKVFIFALGAAAGSLVTWKIVEEKYKAIANDEIASVVEQFTKRMKNEDDELLDFETSDELVEDQEDEFTEEEKEEYKEMVKEYAYDTSAAESAAGYIAPYVISPDEFGEFGNRSRSLTYYSDFVLVDEEDQIVSYPESLIGDGLNHFGKFEDDAVHVRNEALECDFEILKSEKTFSEVYKEDD